MDDLSARLSKDGKVLCGRPGTDGRYTCDEPLAAVVRVGHGGGAVRRLAALAGWTQDRKGVWQQTTRVTDLRRHGINPAQTAERQRLIEFPALARCPKCRAVQWLDADRLRVSNGDEPSRNASNRWVPRL